MAQQQKISRKELLKDDEFIEHAPDVIDWLEKNRAVVIRAVAGILVIVIALGAWSLWSNRRRDAAAELLEDGMKAYRPVAPAGATEAPAADLAGALAAFEKAAASGGSSGVGVTASFYRASVLLDLGRAAEAAPILEQVVASAPSPSLAASARALLATTYESAGDLEKAAGVLTQLAADPDGIFPADAALMRLAAVLEAQGKTAEARAAYQDLLNRFPDGTAAAEARTELQRLEALSR